MTVVETLQKRLRNQRVMSVLLITVAVSASLALVAGALFDLTVSESYVLAVGVGVLLTGIYYRAGSFLLPPAGEVTRYLDRTYPMFEDSSGLYQKESKNRLEELQLMRIESRFSSSEMKIKLPRKRLLRSVAMSALLLMTAGMSDHFLTSQTGADRVSGSVGGNDNQARDEQSDRLIPAIESVQITVNPPDYTALESAVTKGGSVIAPAMSDLVWAVDITGDLTEAALIFNEREKVDLASSGDKYTASVNAENRRIYRIMASNRDTTIYSDYYSIEVTDDTAPRFLVSSPNQIRTLLTEGNPMIDMRIEVVDDYGIRDVYLNATLARGSGESVRFREQRMEFDRINGLGGERAEAEISLHTDSLEMAPGDELYVYATATDNHPDSQMGRSDTYMIILEDTTRTRPLMAGNIVIDLMPEDFRSQRQIIVDTEELLSEKGQMSEEYFKVRSRRIGRDQEMLMLDFGQYMSMEDESESAGGDITEAADDHAGHDHGHEEGGEGVTEAELDGEGQEATQSTAASIIPEEFFHDRGSPEINTLFAESPRALLRRALSEMFRASQYLQTDRPEEALAYEYRALEYLQEAQQADRRYVRRAGLDGIPIPEDEKRLTGEIDDFANPEFSYRSDRRMPPLVLFEQQIRDEQNLSEDELQKHIEEIQKANITESDKLYLLNRVGRLNSTDYNGAVRQQLLAKLSEINRNRQRNLSPERVPVLKTSGGNK